MEKAQQEVAESGHGLDGRGPKGKTLGNPKARRQAMYQIKRDRVSRGITGNPVTKCHTPMRAGERKPLAKREKQRDKMSQENKRNKAGSRYPNTCASGRWSCPTNPNAPLSLAQWVCMIRACHSC